MSDEFQLVLQDREGKREAETIQVQSGATVDTLKSLIQDQFCIPSCCQKLYFGSLQLRDDDSLALHSFRVGDVVHVQYDTKADIHEVLNALSRLRNLLHMLMDASSDVVKFNTAIVNTLPVNVVILNQLGERYFAKFATDKYYSNMAFFITNEGLDMLLKSHQLLLEYSLSPLLVLEAVFLLLWARLSLMRNCLSGSQLKNITAVLLGSFQRYSIEKCSGLTRTDGSQIKKDVILLSLRAISNLTATYGGIRESIASTEGAMCQLNNVLDSINSSSTVVGVLGTFENLSESESTHVYLSTPNTIKSLIGVCHRSNTDFMSANHFRMGVARTLSTLVVSSAHVMTLPELLRINMFLQETLAKVDIDAAHKFLHEKLCGWIGTLKGIVNVAYYPYHNPRFSCVQSYYSKEHTRVVRQLEQRCVEVGIVSLHTALLGDIEKQVLVKEGLVDYVVCLPWCVPKQSATYHRALSMITYLRGTVQLQPPSLLNLAKAKLASTHFGLKKMLNTFSMQDLLHEGHYYS